MLKQVAAGISTLSMLFSVTVTTDDNRFKSADLSEILARVVSGKKIRLVLVVSLSMHEQSMNNLFLNKKTGLDVKHSHPLCWIHFGPIPTGRLHQLWWGHHEMTHSLVKQPVLSADLSAWKITQQC